MSEEKKGFFGRLKEGLKKTRDNIVSGMDSIFSGYSEIDEDFYEEIEETLIMGDLGVHTTEKILEDLKRQVKEERIKDPSQCREKLIESIRRQMDLGENAYEFRQDDLHRQTGRTAEGPGQKGHAGGGRYLPGGGHGAAF